MSTEIYHTLRRNTKEIPSDYRYKKRELNNFSLLLIITVCFFLTSACFTVITRAGLKTKEEKNIPAISSNISLLEEEGVDGTAGRALTILCKVMALPGQTGQTPAGEPDYYNLLKEYISKPVLPMTLAKTDQMEDKIEALQDIIDYEENSDFTKMSIDGRRIAIYISKQIFELCGLRLDFSMEGRIEAISDLTGDNIYAKDVSVSKNSIHINALIITVSSLIILLIICIIIARRNQLFVKEVVYDGFDEERFA